MSLIGEQLAEEWLNRQGFFTIRGVKVGNGEMDLLAVKQDKGNIECWHFEVQLSLRPVSYICPAPKELRRAGKSPHNASKRSTDEAKQAVKEWLEKKYFDPEKDQVRSRLWPGKWKFGFIVGNVRHHDELDLISAEGVKVFHMVDHLQHLSPLRSKNGGRFILEAASGADLLDLVFAQEQLKKEIVNEVVDELKREH